MNSKPIAIERNRCNCTALRKATRRLSQLYDAALAPSGLKSTQFSMLNEIARRRDEPPTIGEMAEALVMDQSTLGQNLRPLERDGLISFAPDQKDRRYRRVKLTKKGRSHLNAAIPLWAEAQADFEKSFGTEDAANLRTVLIGIANRAALTAEPAGAAS